jgi:hypothetical protein
MFNEVYSDVIYLMHLLLKTAASHFLVADTRNTPPNPAFRFKKQGPACAVPSVSSCAINTLTNSRQFSCAATSNQRLHTGIWNSGYDHCTASDKVSLRKKHSTCVNHYFYFMREWWASICLCCWVHDNEELHKFIRRYFKLTSRPNSPC